MAVAAKKKKRKRRRSGKEEERRWGRRRRRLAPLGGDPGCLRPALVSLFFYFFFVSLSLFFDRYRGGRGGRARGFLSLSLKKKKKLDNKTGLSRCRPRAFQPSFGRTPIPLPHLRWRPSSRIACLREKTRRRRRRKGREREAERRGRKRRETERERERKIFFFSSSQFFSITVPFFPPSPSPFRTPRLQTKSKTTCESSVFGSLRACSSCPRGEGRVARGGASARGGGVGASLRSMFRGKKKKERELERSIPLSPPPSSFSPLLPPADTRFALPLASDACSGVTPGRSHRRRDERAAR